MWLAEKISWRTFISGYIMLFFIHFLMGSTVSQIFLRRNWSDTDNIVRETLAQLNIINRSYCGNHHLHKKYAEIIFYYNLLWSQNRKITTGSGIEPGNVPKTGWSIPIQVYTMDGEISHLTVDDSDSSNGKERSRVRFQVLSTFFHSDRFNSVSWPSWLSFFESYFLFWN